MFICLSTYLRPLSDPPELLETHRAYLREMAAHGDLVCAGPRASRDGGVLVFTTSDAARVEALMGQDPLARAGAIDYEVIAFDARVAIDDAWLPAVDSTPAS